MQKKQGIQGVIIWSLLSLGVSYLLTGQINPISIYQAQVSLLAKIVVSVLLLLLTINLFGLIFISVAPDNPCPICNKGLISYSAVYGAPIICKNCSANGRMTMYHTNCIKAAGQCPVCAQHDPMNDLHKF